MGAAIKRIRNLGFILLAGTTSAHAEDVQGWRKGDIVVSAGIAVILFDSAAEIALGGARIDGGTVKLSNNTLLSGSAEWFNCEFTQILTRLPHLCAWLQAGLTTQARRRDPPECGRPFQPAATNLFVLCLSLYDYKSFAWPGPLTRYDFMGATARLLE